MSTTADSALIVHPWNAKYDLSFRLNDSVDDSALDIFGVLFQHRLERNEHFLDSLVKFDLTGIAL